MSAKIVWKRTETDRSISLAKCRVFETRGSEKDGHYYKTNIEYKKKFLGKDEAIAVAIRIHKLIEENRWYIQTGERK